MKWTNFGIILALFSFAFSIIISSRVWQVNALGSQQKHYDQALDRAIDDAVENLVEIKENEKLELNKDRAVEQFYLSLYSNFGILGDSLQENVIRSHIPIILVTDEDGYYIQYTDGAEGILRKHWSEKLPYVWQDGDYIYHFTLTDYLRVYNQSTNEIIEGYVTDLQGIYPGLFEDMNQFDTIRRSAVISSMEKQMNSYINQYNLIAEQFGIQYKFWLPAIEKNAWYRTIDDRSLFVIFQGYPYQNNELGVYNRYTYGGARIKKGKTYFIAEEDVTKYYHRESCTYRAKGDSEIYYSKEECASEGAFPCQYCNP